MTKTPNSSDNADYYAQQWIDFLRQRNAMLSIFSLLALLIAIFMGVVAFYFHQQGKSAVSEFSFYKEKSQQLESQLANQSSHMSRSDDDALAQLNEKIDIQAQQLSEAENQLKLSEEVVDNLNSQLILLKEENAALSNSLSKVRESLLSDASAGEVLKNENHRLTIENKALAKKLSDGKGAYLAVVKRHKASQSEIDFLAEENHKLKQANELTYQRIETLKTQVSGLSEANASLISDLDKSQNDYQSLEDKLASIMSPIGIKPKEETSDQAASPGQRAFAPMEGGDGLEEIQIQKPSNSIKKVKEPISGVNGSSSAAAANANFDYDKISIP
jgi:uncharacterized protein HemX